MVMINVIAKNKAGKGNRQGVVVSLQFFKQGTGKVL